MDGSAILDGWRTCEKHHASRRPKKYAHDPRSIAPGSDYIIIIAPSPRGSTFAAIQGAFSNAGVLCLDPGDIRDGGHGVRLKVSG